jgi:hypothetical protein
MSVIRIKRRSSGASGAPASLQNAELAFNEVDGILYYGKGTGGAGGSATSIEAIGGKAMVSITGPDTITGEKTFSAQVTIPDGTAASHAITKGQLDAAVLGAGGAVTSVAGRTGAIVLTTSDVTGAASTSYVDTKVASLVNGAPGTLDTLKELSDALGADANFATTVANSIALKANASALSTVAFSGSYADLSNKPSFDGSYASLTGAPTYATVATSGSYADLTNKPTLFDGAYASLTGKPALTTVAVTGSYTDLINQPTIPTQYTDALARAAISLSAGASGATYNATTGVLDLSAVTGGGGGGSGTVTSVALSSSGTVTISGSPITTTGTISVDVNQANLSLGSIGGTLSTAKITGLATVATSGSYTDLTNQPTIPSAYSDTQARAAISVTGSLAYNASTGVISYTAPTVVSAFTNDAGYLTAADLDGGSF